ncbi:MAG: protein kinase domain-containing protein, partial [Planctomyces sp.]
AKTELQQRDSENPVDPEEQVSLLRKKARAEKKLTTNSQRLALYRGAEVYALPLIPQDQFLAFTMILGLILVLTAIKLVCMFCEEVLVGSVVEQTVMRVRKACFRQILNLDLQTVRMHGTSNLMARLTYDIEALLARLEPTDREILMQRLQGEELEVIASRMKCSERTVRRAMQRIRMQLADYFDVTDDPADLSPSVKARPVTDDDGRSSLPPLNTRPTPSIRYQELTLEAMIGRGGFGRVYRARWKSIDCPIAVKFLNKKFWHHDLAVRALVEESQKVQFISHRHIIRHHGWGQAPSGAPFLVMDLIDGSNLTDWIQHPSFDVSEIESCGIQICDALIALHQSGILHGDISPGNVLRRAPHDFVLTDFGFSRSVHETHLARGGTPGFLAPEQLSSAFGAISEHTDLYGFGALLYFLATRTAPFEGDDESDVLNQVLSSRSPAPISEHCGLPQKLMMGIMKCLSKVPSQRGTAMSSLRRELFRI